MGKQTTTTAQETNAQISISTQLEMSDERHHSPLLRVTTIQALSGLHGHFIH